MRDTSDSDGPYRRDPRRPLPEEWEDIANLLEQSCVPDVPMAHYKRALVRFARLAARWARDEAQRDQKGC
jgi:hypothetical protein